MAVDAGVVGHGSSSLLNLARIGIADREASPLDRRQDDHLEQVASTIRPDDQPTVRIFAGVFDSECMVDGVMDVVIGDAVLARRVVNFHHA